MADPAADPDAVWIKTEPALDGSGYVVTIEASDDVAVVLDRDRVLAYAYELLRAIAVAEYDAAVLRQLTNKLRLDNRGAVEVITLIRARRSPLDDAATAPLSFQPGVSHRTREAFLPLAVNGQRVGQWTILDAKEHVLAVLEAHAVAELDSDYYRTLVESVGIDEPTARNVVDDLRGYR